MSGLFIGESMDRQTVYPGQILPETTLLQMTKDAMISVAKLSSAVFGTGTTANGFAVTPTGPASLQVVCAPGEIYSMTSVDASAFSSLPADTTHSILKQGILLDGVTLNCPAPGTTGQSINYLIQVTYQDADSSPVLLPYYNSANPALPYSGMGNNGLSQNTIRKGLAVVTAKAGASATTGSQVTPAPDVGYIGLYVVTVAFGQTTITSGNIAVLGNAPLINSTLHGLSPVFGVPVTIAAATQNQHAVQMGQLFGGLKGVAKYTSSGSFTVPAGVTTIYLSACGGGGGGGFSGTTSSSVSGGGGGGGAGQSCLRATYTVTPGQVISFTVGAGGGSGGNGTSTVVGSLITLLGGFSGGAGGAGSVGTASGGAGGAGSPSGCDGADAGNTAGAGGSGGAGASSPFGGGGRAARSGFGGAPFSGAGAGGSASSPGSGYGGGGGGAGGQTSAGTQTGAPGGAGAPGLVIFEW